MMQPEPQAERFSLGRVVATAGLLRELEAEQIAIALTHHAQGDWGDLNHEDCQANETALQHGDRVLSSYWIPSRLAADGVVRIYVITEADRSTTTALLTSEY